jgi:hypothetical protein
VAEVASGGAVEMDAAATAVDGDGSTDDVAVGDGCDAGDIDGTTWTTGVATGSSDEVDASAVAPDVEAAARGVTGWIETYLPSQIIRRGAYRQRVKNRLSWAVVSFLFGFMS